MSACIVQHRGLIIKGEEETNERRSVRHTSHDEYNNATHTEREDTAIIVATANTWRKPAQPL